MTTRVEDAAIHDHNGPHGDYRGWLSHHHRSDTDANGDVVHIFAVQEGDVFGRPREEKCFRIEVPIGPVKLMIEVCFNIADGTFSVCVYVIVPLLPPIKLGCASGSLRHGIIISPDVPPIISGKIHFYIKDGYLWMGYDVNIFGTELKNDVKLIPIPGPPHHLHHPY